MAERAAQRVAAVESFDEKQFYLDEFRGHTLLFALAAEDLTGTAEVDCLASLVHELAGNGTRVVVLVGAPAASTGRLRRRLQRGLGSGTFREETGQPRPRRGARPAAFEDVPADTFAAESGATALLSRMWAALRRLPLFVGILPGADRFATFLFAQHIATRLQVHKLVLMEPEGGLVGADGKPLSFLDESMLTALLGTGQAEWIGLAGRRATVEIIRAAVRGGAMSVNLCSLPTAARELFTYEGSGTLFTLADYCTVERLGIDDFEEVERLIERGHREGLLKKRSAEEVAAMLLAGYGAKIGARHLAGICALITTPYRAQRAGEIVGLYTITRFKGEGVGVRLVDRVVADARAAGLAYLFATTTVPRAQLFFERRGFRGVGQGEVPAVKWRGYDRQRRQRVVALRIDLQTDGSKGRGGARKKRG